MAFVGGVGAVNIDLLYTGADHIPAPGEEVYAREFGVYLGGGTPGTLVTLGRLGVPSKILTFLGRDMFSSFARREFEAAGAEVVDLYGGDGMPVTISSTMVVDGDRAFMSCGRQPEITEAMLQTLRFELAGAKVVPMDAGLTSLYRALKAGGTKLVFDTGWEDDMSLEKHAESLALADYYLPNRREALKITGAASVEDAARVLGRYMKIPIVKLDCEGCLYLENGAVKHVPPVPGVSAVDTTGAGDAFRAGFIYGLFHEWPVEQCVQFGNVTGAACVRALGCLTGYVDEPQLLKERERIYG